MTKTKTATGVSLRKYSSVIHFLTEALSDTTVPVETRLECAKELDSIYRRADASRERQRARDFRWRVLTAEKAVKVKEEVQDSMSGILLQAARQAEAAHPKTAEKQYTRT